MSDKTIDEVTPDTNVTGAEKLPVSDGGTPKSMTVNQVKDFVIATINSLTTASGIDVSDDGVFIKKDGSIKPLSATALADAVIAHAFGQDAPSALAGTDEIVISKSDVAKVTTLSDLAQYVKDSLTLGNVDFDDYTTASAVDGDTLFVVGNEDEEESVQSEKATLNSIADKLANGLLFDKLSTSASPLDANADYLVVENVNTEGQATVKTVKKVKVGNAGLATGNVSGPASNTGDKIPQWNGNNSKTLKDGLSVSASITSGSQSGEVPTALAVYNAVSGRVAAPASNTDGNIPQWNGSNSKTLKDGIALATAVGSPLSNGKILTEYATVTAISNKITSALSTGPAVGEITTAISNAISTSLASGGAIRTQLDGCAKAPASTFVNYIPQWTSTNKELQNGKQVVTTVSSSSTDDQIPTAKAVSDAIAMTDTTNFVKTNYTTTQGQIPKWSSTNKTFDSSGYSVSNIVNTYGSQNELATTQAIVAIANEKAKSAVTVSSSSPNNSLTGHYKGEMYYCTSGDSGTKGLYINTGNYSSATWVRIAVPV